MPTPAATATPAQGVSPTPSAVVSASRLVFESRSQTTGKTVDIPLNLSGAGEGVGNMDIDLSYDPSVLKATEVVKGGLTADALFDYNITGGSIGISLADRQGFSGDGSVAIVKFNVTGAEGSSSPLRIVQLFANRASDSAPMVISTRDGTFTVLSAAEQLKGDINGDRRLTALDALIALQMAVGKRPVDLVLDVSGDGKVTSLDARRILQVAIGIADVPGVPRASAASSPAQLIASVAGATTDAEREIALERLIAQGYSLGILDENGNQVNRNVAADAASLNPDDLAALNWLTAEGYSRPIGSVVDYLAAAGVVMASTGNVITFQDFLPELQRYVNWSFQNPSDPKSSLGLLLASGPDMNVPRSPPTFTEWTPISPTASMLMLADVLLGVKEPPQKQASGWFNSVAYAADLQETAQEIEGLLIIAKPVLKELGYEIPEVAAKLLAAFAAGNRFAVRLVDSRALSFDAEGKAIVVRRYEHPAVNLTAAFLEPVVVLVPSGQVLRDVPAQYTLNLLSSFDMSYGAGPLYPDADMLMTSDKAVKEGWAKMGLGGHRLEIDGKLPAQRASFAVFRGNIANTEPRGVFLHAAAAIPIPNIVAILLKYGTPIMSVLEFDQFIELYEKMEAAAKVTPWFTTIVMAPKTEVTLEPANLQGEPNKAYTFTATIKNAPKDFFIEWVSRSPEGNTVRDGKPGETSTSFTWQREGTCEVSALVRLEVGYTFGEAAYIPFSQPGSTSRVSAAKTTVSVIIRDKPAEPSGAFPSYTFQGPVNLLSGASAILGSAGLTGAGRISLSISSSGRVTGTWGGDSKDQQGRLVYTFKGSFSGTAEYPDAPSFTVPGNYEISRYNRDGSLAQTLSGKWEASGVIQMAVDPAGGPPRVGGARATIFSEGLWFADWKSD